MDKCQGAFRSAQLGPEHSGRTTFPFDCCLGLDWSPLLRGPRLPTFPEMDHSRREPSSLFCYATALR